MSDDMIDNDIWICSDCGHEYHGDGFVICEQCDAILCRD